MAAISSDMGFTLLNAGSSVAPDAATAQINTKTMESMTSTPTESMQATRGTDPQTVNAQIVSNTLNALNESSQAQSTDFQFQTQVLGAAYTGKGSIVDVNA